MNALIKGLFVYLAATAVAAVAFGESAIEVEANRSQIYLGEPVILTVKVSGAPDAGMPDLSAITNASIKAYAPQSQSYYSTTYVNGRVQKHSSSTVIYTYEITPAAAGSFTAGPVKLMLGGKAISKPGPVIAVEGIQKQDLVIAAVKASRDAVMVDEPFDITMTIAIKRLGGRFADNDPIVPASPIALTVPYLELKHIDGLQDPDLVGILNARCISRNNPGFCINGLKDDSPDSMIRRMMSFGTDDAMTSGDNRYRFMLDRKPVTINGVEYFQYELTVTYKALKEGNYTFGPLDLKGSIISSADSAGRATMQPVWTIGPAVTVRVLLPPDQGRPPSFIGARGSNITVSASLDAQTCSVGDPLTLTLSINGNMRMDNVYPPDLAAQPALFKDFRINEDSVQISTKDQTRTYKYTVRPVRAGTLEFPPVEIAYYDLKERAYRTVKTKPLPVRADEALIVNAGMVVSSATNSTAEKKNEDGDESFIIAPLDVDESGADRESFNLNTWQLVLLLSGPAVFGLTLLGRSARSVITSRSRANRIAKAGVRARSRLSAAMKHGTLQGKALNSAIFDALRLFLSERFDLPPAGLTPADAAGELERRGVDTALAARFCKLFEHNFNAVYTNIGTAGAPSAADPEEAIRILDELDACTRKPGVSSGRTISVIAFLLAGCAASYAGDAEERRFIWEEANSRMTTARSREDFAHAARSYEKLLKLGVRNGPLFYNLGTALLRSGQYEESVRMLERAERYSGTTRDIRQNMLIAIARHDKDRNSVMPWYRIFLFWHYELSLKTRINIALASFTIFWLLLTCRLLGMTGAGKLTHLAAAGIVMAIFVSSAATSLNREQRDDFIALKIAAEPSAAPARMEAGK